ncbi:hypothetical protein [Streptomyces wuyuanensis]|uniref:hypothetical protein n=1 Tax=Streptomyces wuyuanensis TaxID=1196353 RepID=UPI0034410A12
MPRSRTSFADLAVQTALNAAGVQDGCRTTQTVQAGKDGLQFGTGYDTHTADMIAGLERNRKFQAMLKERGWTIGYDILK